MSLNKFFSDCLALPYKPNSQDNPEHENQVEQLLIKHKLNYLSQPNGIQNSPDFYVFCGEKRYSIECKSSKGHYPMYNGGLPKPDTIYIFSSKKYNSTTLYNANDILTLQKRKLYDSMLIEMNEVLTKYKKMDGWQDKRGFDFYIRSMYTQSGGKKKVDYFAHEERKICEESVLNAVY